jgi:hypothetical protein
LQLNTIFNTKRTSAVISPRDAAGVRMFDARTRSRLYTSDAFQFSDVSNAELVASND